ncbi:MAG TPA: hypothetical protein VNH19_23005 [Candidatus Limnocylindrales bacterium]|jgi:hypothetical protein|nr:hypothetical protein [Candidatus Limnocylindrales bacterium]
MSTQRIGGEVVFECDGCGETFELGDPDFTTTWNAAKRDGWTTRKIGKDWIHTCGDCNIEEDNK